METLAWAGWAIIAGILGGLGRGLGLFAWKKMQPVAAPLVPWHLGGGWFLCHTDHCSCKLLIRHDGRHLYTCRTAEILCPAHQVEMGLQQN